MKKTTLYYVIKKFSYQDNAYGINDADKIVGIFSDEKIASDFARSHIDECVSEMNEVAKTVGKPCYWKALTLDNLHFTSYRDGNPEECIDVYVIPSVREVVTNI